MQSYLCSCGGQLTWVPQYQRWYCYRCNKYAGSKSVDKKVRTDEEIRGELLKIDEKLSKEERGKLISEIISWLEIPSEPDRKKVVETKRKETIELIVSKVEELDSSGELMLSSDAYLRLGTYYYGEVDLKRARDFFDRCVRKDQGNINGWYGKGLTYNFKKKRDEGELEEALKCYDKVLSMNERHVRALCCKASDLRVFGRRKEALECVLKAISIDSNYADAWFVKGVIADDEGRIDEAKICYDKAILLDAGHGDARTNKARLLIMEGKNSEALVLLDSAISMDENNADAWNNKGVALFNLGRITEALECFEKALLIDPLHEDAKSNLLAWERSKSSTS